MLSVILPEKILGIIKKLALNILHIYTASHVLQLFLVFYSNVVPINHFTFYLLVTCFRTVHYLWLSILYYSNVLKLRSMPSIFLAVTGPFVISIKILLGRKEVRYASIPVGRAHKSIDSLASKASEINWLSYWKCGLSLVLK